MKIPPKKFVQRKMPGKIIRAAITSEKKIRASKQQSTNSLEKKFVQRLNALKKKSCGDMRLKKKFVPQNFYTPPPGISNGPPLSIVSFATADL